MTASGLKNSGDGACDNDALRRNPGNPRANPDDRIHRFCASEWWHILTLN